MPKEKKARIIRMIVTAAVLCVLLPVGYLTGLFKWGGAGNLKMNLTVLLKLIVMVCGVICAEALAVFILGQINPDNHRVRTVLSVIASVLKYVAAIVIICWGLSIIGVNVSTIVASVGIVALVVGFSAESLIADMVTGAFMVFENQYNVGDIVEIGGFRGTVKIVNNSAMKNILNRSDKPSRAASEIGVPYGTDFRKLESEIPGLMDRILEAHPDVFKKTPVYLGVNELADSAVVLKFVAEVDEANIFSGTRILNHDLLLGFKDLGVEVPFPQVDVHNIPVK